MLEDNTNQSYLHDSLKIEGSAVPQGEFTTSTTCEQTPPLWSPFHHIHRMAHLVKGGMKMLRRYRVDSVSFSRGRRENLHVESVSVFNKGKFRDTTTPPLYA